MSAITKHAKERGRERFRLKLSSMVALAAMALEKGLKPEDTAGQLRRYLDGKLDEHPDMTLRIYAEKVLVYGERNALVTVYPLPREHRATVAKIRGTLKRQHAMLNPE